MSAATAEIDAFELAAVDQIRGEIDLGLVGHDLVELGDVGMLDHRHQGDLQREREGEGGQGSSIRWG
ncbi:hypothetical protein L3X38_036192 [Prunus dulcis]|uniref:Uncharacterized protein n=1 Tax=Prunus dulcis TaxID=3755 RepID=A0AAD4V0S1_PRUDU|nr:hypothetical protein L3X38_036192 [Prunus dulcis]